LFISPRWVLSFPYPLRFLFASHPAIMGQVLGIVYLSLPKTRAARRHRFTTPSPMLGRSDDVPLYGNAGA